MPYITKTIKEARKEFKKSNKVYKLCYIDSIPQTTFGYRPEIKEKYKFLEGLSYDEYRNVSWKYPEYRMEDLPNPDYISGEHEYYAYFTPLDLDEQWGDDWDDYPYECNAEIPYDSKYEEKDENGNWKEYEIIKVPFYVDSWKVYFPSEWGHDGNSPFCVRDINAGAVAWIYYAGQDGKSGKGSVAIHAGVNPFEFIEKIEKINND